MSALTSNPAMTTGPASVTVKNKIGLGLSALLAVYLVLTHPAVVMDVSGDTPPDRP